MAFKEWLCFIFILILFVFFYNRIIGINLSTKKKTMYEILGVPPTASLTDIKAAYKCESLKIMSGALGLSRDDCNFQLNLLDVALHTLSNPYLRDVYDAELAPENMPTNIVSPVRSSVLSIGGKEKALMLASSLEETYKNATVGIDSYKPQIEAVSSVVGTSVKSMKTLMRIFIGLAVLAFIIKAGQMTMASRQDGRATPEVAKAEDKLIIQEYYKKHGVRPASRAEAEFLEGENRRLENEQRAVVFEEKKKEDEYNQFVKKSRDEGERVHEALVRAEESDRQEERRKQQVLAEEASMKEGAAQEEERMRIENERRRLGLR